MKVHLKKVSAGTWESLCAENAHAAVFGEKLPPGFERIDYALLAIDEISNTAIAYMTVRELDKETVYLKRGGAFESLPVATRARVYRAMLNWLDDDYKRMTTLVENTNVRYLKLAMSAGFRAIGIRNFEGSILLELLRNKGE